MKNLIYRLPRGGIFRNNTRLQQLSTLPPRDSLNNDISLQDAISLSKTTDNHEVLKPKIDVKQRLESLIPAYEKIGTIQTLSKPKNEPVNLSSSDLTMSKMLAAGLHLGASEHHFNQKHLPNIFGSRAGINIFNLELTLPYLRRACGFVRDVAYRGGIILFVSSRPDFAPTTIKAAQKCQSYYVYKKWVPGTITNRTSVLGSKSFVYYEGEVSKAHIYKPDVIIIANVKDNMNAVHEATRQNVPTIALVDSDVDPQVVTYPIPGNDDTVRGIELTFGLLSKSIQEGKIKKIREDEQKVRSELKKLDNKNWIRKNLPTEEEIYSLEP